MKKILILTDYKGFFGSKQKGPIYRGGMHIPSILSLFRENGYIADACELGQVDFQKILKERPIILYTSSEDINNNYKSFIEDIIYHLESNGIFTIPSYEYLKAHNNKVAMELLRERSSNVEIKTIHTEVFGTLEELKKKAATFTYPVVIKPASGAMSKGVAKADDSDELIEHAKKISRTTNFLNDSKEHLRKLKYGKRYSGESFYRNKFIVQNFIPNLNNDWKVLVYDNRCYVLYRGNRENDFRASGSGKFEFHKEVPSGMLDFAFNIKEQFRVPHISLDIGFDGLKFHLIEFQFLYFGTTTLEKSSFYFVKNEATWDLVEEKSALEAVYANSIISYLKTLSLQPEQ